MTLPWGIIELSFGCLQYFFQKIYIQEGKHSFPFKCFLQVQVMIIFGILEVGIWQGGGGGAKNKGGGSEINQFVQELWIMVIICF